MTDPVKEQLSACLDGELPEAELDLLLKQVQRDPQLSQSMSRYALMSEVLRTGASPTVSSGFAARISAAIAAESAPEAKPASPPRVSAPRWLRPVGGAAIAAGVAALVVMSLQPEIPDAVAPLADTKPSAAADKYTVPTTTPAQSPQLVPATYLAKYALMHSEYAQPLGRPMVLTGVLSNDDSEQSETVDISTPPEGASASSAEQP